MNDHLLDAARYLADYLGRKLPELADDWWNTRVAAKLTFRQQESVAQRGHSALDQLDLAALLRVLNQNLPEIHHPNYVPQELRNYAHEMTSVRNRWAHQATMGVSADDHYRDLDTLLRFLRELGAPTELLARIDAARLAVVASRVVPASAPTPVLVPTAPLPAAPAAPPVVVPEARATRFVPGDVVRLKADPTSEGAVIMVQPGDPETRYTVLLAGRRASYYESQLEAPPEGTDVSEAIGLAAFHAFLSALQLRHPGTAKLYSLQAARVDPIAYQFRPVIKFVQADRPRLLIADDVGVGKTIEAGLILRELQARKDVERVLVICPKPLVAERKWESELRRFDEQFVALDGKTLRSCIDEADADGVWPDRFARAIVPFSLLTAESLGNAGKKGGKGERKGFSDLEPPPHFDLVIVDEAHHLRNASTQVHQNVEFLTRNAEAVIFLSATPIQLGSDDLFRLLNLLRPDLVVDLPSFRRMAEPNPHINEAVAQARSAAPGWQAAARAALDQAITTSWGATFLRGNPDFQRVYDRLDAPEIAIAERVALMRELEQFHTFATLINRTRRRDIAQFTVRKSETVTVPFTPAQQRLHDAVLDLQRTMLERKHGGRNVQFMMTTLRRQAASCLYGLAPTIKGLLAGHLEELETIAWESFGEADAQLAAAEREALRQETTGLLALAEALDPEDPKLDNLLRIVEGKQKAANNKLLVFSSFRHTLAYLRKALAATKVRVGLIQGDVADEDRRSLRDRFARPKEDPEAIDVLLSSEVGCEGLDYQFCDALVNYDLPWNPMRVEQRIGRIDRHGQKSETVAITNFVTPGTVDFDIYTRCLQRIGVFERALGGSEEILGRLTDKLREIAESLTLTPEEREARLQQLADNEVRALQEQQQLEESQPGLFGVQLTTAFDDELKGATSFWLSPAALRRLVARYLEGVCGAEVDPLPGDRSVGSLRLSAEHRAKLLEDFKTLPAARRSASKIHKDWEAYLKGGQPHFLVTFEAAAANERRDAALINPVHPLAQQAARALEPMGPVRTAFRVRTDRVAPGAYPFAVYKWNKLGIRDGVEFQPVCSEAALGEAFFDLLERAEPVDPAEVAFPEPAAYEALDPLHQRCWADALADHREYMGQLASYRRESLTTSHQAHAQVLAEQIAAASDEKIRRMKERQLAKVDEDFARRLAEIERGAAQADIHHDSVAFGVALVEPAGA